MALNNVGDLQSQFLVRNNRTTTDAFITDTYLNDWVREAYRFASGYKKWPFTEGRVSTTYVADNTSIEVGFGYPEGWKPDSIRFLQVGGKRFKKTNFVGYQKFREDWSSSKDKIFSDYGMLYFINPNADVSGTTTLWGQYNTIIDPTDKTATTVFSDIDEKGNDAIVERMTVYLKRRENLTNEAAIHDKLAREMLEEVWKQIADEQYNYQDADNEGMFKRVDVLRGDFYSDIIKKNQWF